MPTNSQVNTVQGHCDKTGDNIPEIEFDLAVEFGDDGRARSVIASVTSRDSEGTVTSVDDYQVPSTLLTSTVRENFDQAFTMVCEEVATHLQAAREAGVDPAQ